MGVVDRIRSLLSALSDEPGNRTERSGSTGTPDQLPVEGGMLLDGLVWVGKLEVGSEHVDTTTETTLEGPRCPECDTDVRWESVQVVDAVPPVDGGTGGSVYESLADKPDCLPVEEVPVSRYVDEYFDEEPRIRVPRCPLCQYTTIDPLVSDRTYDESAGDYETSADNESAGSGGTRTGAEPGPPSVPVNRIVSDHLERDLQRALESASSDPTVTNQDVWDRYRSRTAPHGPYELVDPTAPTVEVPEETRDIPTPVIDHLAGEASIAANSGTSPTRPADVQLPEDAVARMEVIAALVAAVSTTVDALYDAQLDADRRAELRTVVDRLREETAAVDPATVGELASERPTHLYGLLEARARLAVIDRFLAVRENVSALLSGCDDDGISPTPAGLTREVSHLETWLAGYEDDMTDYLTVEEALPRYETATAYSDAITKRLETDQWFLGESLTDQLRRARSRLADVRTFVEERDAYNESWLEEMTEQYGAELDSFFDDPDAAHNDSQRRAIFRNDNYNRVNAAAGTGKTTTLGRRVHFLTTEFDDVAPGDILAITFTRSGVREMETELAGTFDITGLAVRTLHSYGNEVARAQRPGLHMLTEEARRTELADTWEAVLTSEAHQNHYSTFIDAWKSENYTPENEDERSGLYNRLANSDTVTIRGEDLNNDEATEESVAHQLIAKWLTRSGLEYDYKRYADWTELRNDQAYIVDFRVETPADMPEVWIEYWPTRPARADWPGYKAAAEPEPRTIRNLFDEHAQGDAVTEKRVIVIEGTELLSDEPRTAGWEADRFRQRLGRDLPAHLEERFGGVLGDEAAQLLRPRRSDTELEEDVYETYQCDRLVLETVEEFLRQARVREWNPREAEERVLAYCEEQTVEPAVESFCLLCLATYERFEERFDDETLTDFHGTQVITRDSLRAGEVDGKHRYDHVLVDEMQDLNRVQFDLVRELSDARPDTRLFGVGDDWQSIFGFRGARPDLFIRFGEQLGAGDPPNVDTDPDSVFVNEGGLSPESGPGSGPESGPESGPDPDPGSERLAFADTRIEENHRCSRPIVAASNEVITNNEVRTEKEPWTTTDGPPITVHHLACELYGKWLDRSMQTKILRLIENSRADSAEIRVVVRQRDGDSAFFYPLADAVPDGVTVQTAHDSKGSEAEHVIIPKVISSRGYPSIRTDRYVRPVKQPPEIYEEQGAEYQIEEERRMFYVALTRAERRVDLLTVDGAESRFIDELPDDACRTVSPFSDAEREQLADGELRKDLRGTVISGQENGRFVHFAWAKGGILDVNLYDATGRQFDRMQSLVGRDLQVVLRNCGLEYRRPSSDDFENAERIQLQIDKRTTIAIDE